MKIILHKLFPYAPYLNEYIGFEDEKREGETELDAVDRLRKLAEQSHRDRYPEMYLNEKPVYKPSPIVEHAMKPTETTIEAIIADIQSCEHIDKRNSYNAQIGLIAYSHLLDNPRIKEAYDKKLKELS